MKLEGIYWGSYLGYQANLESLNAAATSSDFQFNRDSRFSMKICFSFSPPLALYDMFMISTVSERWNEVGYCGRGDAHRWSD